MSKNSLSSLIAQLTALSKVTKLPLLEVMQEDSVASEGEVVQNVPMKKAAAKKVTKVKSKAKVKGRDLDQLAEVRDAYFKKMGYGKYAKKKITKKAA